MSVQIADIKTYRAITNDDTGSNGGKISATAVVSGAKHSIIPAVTAAERTAGVTRYRKLFFRNENTENLAADNFSVGISALSTAADYFRLKAGTSTDIQGAAQSYTNWAGAGLLSVNANSGASSIDVNYDAADGVYSGAVIRISDGVNTETHTVDTVSWASLTATITLDGTTLINGYLAATPTVITTIINLGTMITSSTGWTETSTAGTYDESTYPVITYNKGTVIDTWTVTFISATAFTCAGLYTGSVGSGLIASDFKPISGMSWYFNLRAAGWSGTWAIGDTVSFSTVHAAKSLWLKQIAPAGTTYYTGSHFDMLIDFESA